MLLPRSGKRRDTCPLQRIGQSWLASGLRPDRPRGCQRREEFPARTVGSAASANRFVEHNGSTTDSLPLLPADERLLLADRHMGRSHLLTYQTQNFARSRLTLFSAAHGAHEDGREGPGR